MTAPEPTPTAEHTDAVALDLDGVVAHRDNLAAMIRRLSDFLDGRGLNSWKHGACWAAEDAIKSLTARAEAAEAEVVTLRARLAEVEAELAELRHWTRRDRPRLIAATALVFSRPMILGDFDIRASDLRAALATTGEGE